MIDESTRLAHPTQHRAEQNPQAGSSVLATLLLRARMLNRRHRLILAGFIGLGLVLGGWLWWRQCGDVTLTAEAPVHRIDNFMSLRLVSDEARVHISSQEFAAASPALREAVPVYLEAASPIYDIRVERGAVQIAAEGGMDIAAAPDLYTWDQAADQWKFVPAEIDSASGLLVADVRAGPLALFRVSGAAPLLGTQIAPDQTLGSMSLMDLVFVTGVHARTDGTLTSIVISSETSDGRVVFPVISVRDWDVQSALLNQASIRQAHIRSIVELATNRDFAGVVLDYGEITPEQSEAFHTLVEEIGAELDRHERLLAVRVATPAATESGWDTGGYDWQRLGRSADLIVAASPGNPSAYQDNGDAARFMAWATGQVSRLQLILAFSTLSIDEWGSILNPIAYDYALAPLDAISSDDASNPIPGQPLTFHVSGEAIHLTPGDGTGPFRYDVYTEGGLHTIWVMNGAALRERLSWLAQYRIGGFVLEDFASEGNSPDITQAIEAYVTDQPSTLTSALNIHWTVRGAGGAVAATATTQIGEPLEWTPAEEGEYVVQASIAGETEARRVTAVIVGGQNTGIVPNQEAVVEGAPGLPSERPTAAIIPEGMPLPVYPAGAVGRFELGGQVNHVVNDPDRMQYAGMTWVKFQLAWAEDMDPSIAWDLIRQGRQNGFKVLLSIPGQVKYPTSINVPAYLDFLRGVAYYGPDAIEVWNEANLDFEWPRGQIDGAHYTAEMLAPAYNAIKEVNPNIMVISGALAPTGAFYGDGGCSMLGTGCDDWLYLQQMARAGAANYMDCVGAHFNAGATAPSATTGHPADPGYQHYSWYFGGMLQLYGGTFGRPVCFTELGYLTGEGLGAVPQRFNWAADTTVAEQAAWLAEAAQLSMQNGNVRLVIVWNFDFTYWGEDPMAGYAIVRPDGSCPACDALNSVMP